MNPSVFLTLCVTTAFGAAVVVPPEIQPKFTVPFLPGMTVDMSGLTLSSFFKTMDGWGLFNLGTDVKNMIFTCSNNASGYKEQVLKPEDPRTFLDSTFDPTQKTIIVIHGYAEDGSGGPLSNTKAVVTAYQKMKRPENLCFVDWRKLGRQLNYFDSADNVKKAGLRVAEFLIYLKGAKLLESLDDVHFVGFSLGAHVAATASHFASAVLGEPVGRISGLDAAGPGFLNKADEYRLNPTDATFVDAIHTNMGYLLTTFGTPLVSGHADFYPNGGAHQPGCSLPLIGEIVGVCSHLKAIDYYVNSILGKVYIACPNKAGTCGTDGAQMGEFVDTSTRGQYYIDIPLGQ